MAANKMAATTSCSCDFTQTQILTIYIQKYISSHRKSPALVLFHNTKTPFGAPFLKILGPDPFWPPRTQTAGLLGPLPSLRPLRADELMKMAP